VAAMQAQLAGLLAHEHAPLVLAQKASGVAAQAPLFTSILNCRHSQRPGQGAGGGGGLGGISMIYTKDPTNYPLMAAIDDVGTGFSIGVDAVAPASPGQVCALLQSATASLITALEDAPATPLRAVEVLDAAEREQILAGWNDTEAEVPAGTLPALFEARAALSPDAVAVACGEAALSYGALNARANRLARVLAGRGAGAETAVAVVLERSADLVAALLAVL
jgi:hypothetical protein